MRNANRKRFFPFHAMWFMGIISVGSAYAENVTTVDKSREMSVVVVEEIILAILLLILIVLTLLCRKRFVQARKQFDEVVGKKENKTETKVG